MAHFFKKNLIYLGNAAECFEKVWGRSVNSKAQIFSIFMIKIFYILPYQFRQKNKEKSFVGIAIVQID